MSKTTPVPNTLAPSSSADTSPEVSRWINWAAHAVPLVVLPSALWRFALGLGIDVGFTGSTGETFDDPGWVSLYLVLLNAIAEGAALLTLGLVRPWGEVVPRWIPFLGGKRIPTMAAVIPATLGTVVVAIYSIAMLGEFTWNDPGDPENPQGFYALVFIASYLPMLAWAPLLAIVTIAYYRRRSRSPVAEGTTSDVTTHGIKSSERSVA